ncbi:OLC1v1019017C1 [Oldenlandia corymbosa var. corymbosa]|uniref:Beta-galactosidase n=1 Tax=Oldenlandia corymbosa var. corymbosa TaxID=529605 RepID=A0AAV1ECZ7_OLDCO|nr:OLC1v1019017C1 [Oldenlandia corymbosa var. corymbosa]
MAVLSRKLWWQWRIILVALTVQLSVLAGGEYFKPFNVTYDHRALIIDGQRRMLISAGIHYPRATPEMWPDIIAKSKEGGADVIETYTFWNGHEPVRGQYNFEDRYDIVKFAKLVGANGLYLLLRIGPYVCAEWNFGGLPVWLRDIPDIEFRTDNAPFKVEMQGFVEKIVELMRAESLFSWQGGPIILLQIENEYGNIESSFGSKGNAYMKWAAEMAVGLNAGVPWIMCRQVDAPEYILDTCNAYYCDGFRPNSPNKPVIWTEDWDGWYTSWGGRIPHRPVEDIAFAVARFFQRGGSLMNYYMFFGGTNFERTSGGPNQITSYDYDAPVDEYGLLSQPKWGHLKDLHAAIKLCEPALVAADSSEYMKLGPMQEAHVYRGHISDRGQNYTLYQSCSAFLANIDEHKSASVRFLGRVYTLPPWSVSILPDCQNVAFNTAKVGAQISVKSVSLDIALPREGSLLPQMKTEDIVAPNLESWTSWKEPIGPWGDNKFTFPGILEHLNVTKDLSDYLWYKTRVYISEDDVLFWEQNQVKPLLNISSMRDVVRIFVNGKLSGSAKGHWVKVVQPINLSQGYNDVVLLSETVGLQNYGAKLEKDGAGFRGPIKLVGFKNGDLDLTKSSWTYQVGLQGEYQKIYAVDESENARWTTFPPGSTPFTFSWYKTHFDAPDGTDPVSLNLRSMGKGQVWVNGHHIGRYWTLEAPKDGCQNICDYRGAYKSDKCTKNCGEPTQVWYHIPRSWLQKSGNLLVIFEETEKTPFDIFVQTRFSKIICSKVSEDYYPPLEIWSSTSYVKNGVFSDSDIVPVMKLKCEDGYSISSIEFASYGTPHGSCQAFSLGNCHAPSTRSLISQACVGKNSCAIRVSNSIFGDTCRGTLKTLVVQARCSSTSGSSSAM